MNEDNSCLVSAYIRKGIPVPLNDTFYFVNDLIYTFICLWYGDMTDTEAVSNWFLCD